MTAPAAPLALTVTPFDYGTEAPVQTRLRGVMLDAPTSSTVHPSADDFPTVYVCDNGDVEMGDNLRVPRAAAAAWFRAVADYLASQT